MGSLDGDLKIVDNAWGLGASYGVPQPDAVYLRSWLLCLEGEKAEVFLARTGNRCRLSAPSFVAWERPENWGVIFSQILPLKN